MVGRLHDLVCVVVDIVQHWRPARAARTDEAAVGGVHAFRPVLVASLHDLGDAFAAGIGDRQLAVRRFGDPGRARLAIDDADLHAAIEPEGVVTANCAARGRCALIRIGATVLGDFLLQPLPLHSRDLLCIQNEGEGGIATLQRGDAGVGPHALQVGPAVRRARRLVGLRERSRRSRRERDKEDECPEGRCARHHLVSTCRATLCGAWPREKRIHRGASFAHACGRLRLDFLQRVES